MYTRCPSCQTVFALYPDQLEAAGGRVRCSRCLSAFHAKDHALSALPAAPPAGDAPEPARQGPGAAPDVAPGEEPAAREPYSPEAPAEEPAAGEPMAEQPSVEGTAVDGTTGEALPAGHEALPDPAYDLLGGEAPVSEPPRPRPALRLLQMLAIVLLAAGLAIQYAWFEPREVLRRLPAAQPWLAQAFALVGRPAPYLREVAAIRLQSREVRPHPRRSGALIVNAALVSESAYAQPYPGIELTLYDVTGQIIARRTFGPREYLDPLPRGASLMQPARPVQFQLEVLAPQTQAVSYQLRFR